MNQIKKKMTLLGLIGVLSGASLACNTSASIETNADVNEETESIFENHELDIATVKPTVEEPVSEEILYKETMEEPEESVIDRLNIEQKPIVIATCDNNILDKEGNILGTFIENRYLELIDQEDNKYKVNYYGKEAYIDCTNAIESTIYDINSEFEKVLYSTSEITMTIPDYLSLNNKEEYVECNKYECFEVFEENEDNYLVRTDRNIGYISKENVEELTGTFIVVNISNQNLKLYKDNKVDLCARVCTGKPSSPTNEGLFAIYDITRDRYLVGPNYKSYVKYMLKFDNNIGLHDASYSIVNGVSSGWRNENEFGATNENGSHGCVNMIYDDVAYVYENVEEGTPVLVYSYKQ